MREIVMLAGPSEVDMRVIQATCRPSINHLDRRMVAIMDETCQILGEIFQTKGEIILLVSSARGGLEAAITSIMEPGEEIIIVSSGAFGRMLESIAKRIGAKVRALTFPNGHPIDLGEVEEVVEGTKAKALATVHNETSTGALNPAAELGELCRENGLLYILDTVSSLGGVEVRTDDWGVDLCITGSQKCLGCLPGLAIVSVSDRAWKVMKDRKTTAPSFYFDLLRWLEMWVPRERGGQVVFGYRRQPVTMATHLVYALREAVAMIEEEGLAKRFQRHLVNGGAFKAAVRALGLETVPIVPEIESPTVTAFYPPEGIAAPELQRVMRERYGVQVSGGLDELSGRILRVGHMGNTASPEYLVPTVSALELSLRELGCEVGVGSGLVALREAYG